MNSVIHHGDVAIGRGVRRVLVSVLSELCRLRLLAAWEVRGKVTRSIAERTARLRLAAYANERRGYPAGARRVRALWEREMWRRLRLRNRRRRVVVPIREEGAA